MYIYNTLTRANTDIVPKKSGEISLYCCGPTVYDYAHIGNFRKYIFDDLLRRTLENAGYRVRQVTNLTDVGHLTSDADEGDDKLEKKSSTEGKSVYEIAEFYASAFIADADKLKLLPPNMPTTKGKNSNYQSATEYIPQMIELVERLIQKKHAYITEQAIYFDVTSIPDYGKLSGQTLESKEVGVREAVIVDSNKRHPSDFAVWFFKTGHFSDHTMSWESPWGEGFPGWHLECSAIIHASLGEPIDIHTGGVDHIGTHHTNEIAQTEAAFGLVLSHIWAHSEFVLVDGAKMSKSKGNTYKLVDLEAKGFNPLAFKLLVLQAHYKKELNFTWESLQGARNTLDNLYAWADLVFQQSILPKHETVNLDELLAFIQEQLENDLASPAAIAGMLGLTDLPLTYNQLVIATQKLESLFGLGLTDRIDITSDESKLIANREKFRKSGEFENSDKTRLQLEENKIRVEDTVNGSRWRRLS